MNKAVFLDRDGTINVEKHYLYQKEEFEFLPNVIDALKLFQANGYKLIIVTNQSGIGRGYYTEEDFYALNEWMNETLLSYGVKIDGVYFCPHLPDAKIERYRMNCECRKPKLGLYRRAVEEHEIDLSKSYAIGDKIRDCAICEESECKGYLIGENEKPSVIDNVKKGTYPSIRYGATLYDCAKEICKEQTL